MVSDFGLSKIQAGNMLGTACGTPGYVGRWGLVAVSRACLGVLKGTSGHVYACHSPRAPGTEAVWEGGGCVGAGCHLLHPVSVWPACPCRAGEGGWV